LDLLSGGGRSLPDEVSGAAEKKRETESRPEAGVQAVNFGTK